jgi:hypothetical protein
MDNFVSEVMSRYDPMPSGHFIGQSIMKLEWTDPSFLPFAVCVIMIVYVFLMSVKDFTSLS